MLGNPSDGVRDIPDVSLFAANGVWGHFYVDLLVRPESIRQRRSILHGGAEHLGGIWRDVVRLADHGWDSVADKPKDREPSR